MAEEPDNFVLVLLREIRADVTEIKSKLLDHDRRFDRIDRELDDLRLSTRYALG